MINSRDSYTNFNPNREVNVFLPYEVGTIVELKDNPTVLVRINQYRILIKNHRQVVNVGLNTDIYEDEDIIDCEISVDELKEKYRKTDRIIVRNLDSKNNLRVPAFSEYFEREKKLELTRKNNK